MNEFEHDGKPNRKQQAEILKLISMALAYVSMATGSTAYTFSNWPGNAASVGLGASLIAIVLAIWATTIAFLSIKGTKPFLTPKTAAILAAGVLGLGVASAIGVLLGIALA